MEEQKSGTPHTLKGKLKQNPGQERKCQGA